MRQCGIPVDRFYGRLMDMVTWDDDNFVHSNPACREAIGTGPGETRRVRFGPDNAFSMCGCCRVESVAADAGLADAVSDLVTLYEVLQEEAEEAEHRQEPDYVPDFLGPNFNRDHWRNLQFRLSVAAEGVRAHPWLHDWARPALTRAAAHVERRCEEQRTLIDTATLERAAVALQQREQSTEQAAQLWQAWRQREDWGFTTSPDYAYYDKDARLHPPRAGIAGRSTATAEVSVRLPPIGPDGDGFRLVEPLSMWEIAALAAYKTTADWAAGVITLVAPPVVVQELLCPARGLDVTPRAACAGRTPQPPAAS